MKWAIELRVTLLWLLWLQSPIKCGPIPCHLSKNIARYGPNGKIVDCVHCPNCPIGQGLSVPCGSKVSNNSKIECVFCEPNKTYSDDHGKGHCKTCQDCGVRNVIQECTINQNRECGKTCPKGYDFDNTFDDCVEEPESEMSTAISTHSTKTVKLETSGKETTETPYKREAYDVTTTASSNSIDINSSQPKFPSTGVDNTPSQGTSLKGTNNSPYVWSTKEVQLQQDHKALLMAIYVLIAVVIVVTIIVLVIVCKKGQDHSTSKRDGEPRDSAEENFRLTASDESEGSSEATISGSSTQEDLRDPAPQDNTTEPLLLVDISTDNNISVRNEVSSHASDAQGEDDMTVENIPAGNAAEIIPLNDIGESDGSSEATTSSSSTQDNNISRNKASSHASDAQGEDDLNVENIPADILVSGMEMLCDENGTLFKYVQTQLDASETCTRKTWRSVGRELKVHSDTLNLIPPDGCPTEHLLGYLKTLPKEPTMREFVQALKNCGRNDIAKYICNGPWASTKH